MKDNKNKLSTIISLIIIAILILPVFAFLLGGNKGVSTSFKVVPSASEERVLSSGVVLQTEKEDIRVITKAYAYIGDVYNAPDNKITFIIDYSNDYDAITNVTTFFERDKFTVEIPENGFYGWVEISGNIKRFSKYIKVSSKESFALNEIVFVGVTDKEGKKQKQVKIECIGGVAFKDNERKFISLKDQGDLMFSNVCDEQVGLSNRGVNSLSKRENKLQGAISNLISGTGYYVSEYENALGVELISLGVLIFGNNSFGISFIPFLFFVATCFLIFFFAKKIFSCSWYGLAFTILYLLLGMPISLGIMGIGAGISTFFVIASFYFAYNFYKKVKDGEKVVNNVISILLSGIMYALAVAVNLQSAIIIVGLILLTLPVSITQIINYHKIYAKAEGLDKEYARERYVSLLLRVVFGTLVSFVLFPVIIIAISYLVALPTYYGFYKGHNFLTMIFANHNRLFSNAVSSNLFPLWAVGFGSLELDKVNGVSSWITSNKLLVAISFASFIALAVMYFMLISRKIKNQKLCENLLSVKFSIELVMIAFLSNFILEVVFITSLSYEYFAYSLVFLALSPLLLHRVLKGVISKKAHLALTITLSVAVALFFVLQSSYFFNLAILEKAHKFISWTL